MGQRGRRSLLLLRDGILIYTTFIITPLAPSLYSLCILVFYLGLSKWKRQCSLNNTDFFTFNFAAMELIGAIFLWNLLLMYQDNTFRTWLLVHFLLQREFLLFVILFYCIAILLFYFLACTDHYLTVVHNVIYKKLKSPWWKQIRNAAIGGVWLISIEIMSVNLLKRPTIFWIPFFLCSGLILHTLHFNSVRARETG